MKRKRNIRQKGLKQLKLVGVREVKYIKLENLKKDHSQRYDKFTYLTYLDDKKSPRL